MASGPDETTTLPNEPSLSLGFTLGLRTCGRRRHDVRLAIAPFLGLRRFAMPAGLPALSALEYAWLVPAPPNERRETPARRAITVEHAATSSTPVSTTKQPSSSPAEPRTFPIEREVVEREVVEREVTVQSTEGNLSAVQSPTGSHAAVERPTVAIPGSTRAGQGVSSQPTPAEKRHVSVAAVGSREPLSVAFALGLRPDASRNRSTLRAWCAALTSLDVRRPPTCALAPALPLTLAEAEAWKQSELAPSSTAAAREQLRSISMRTGADGAIQNAVLRTAAGAASSPIAHMGNVPVSPIAEPALPHANESTPTPIGEFAPMRTGERMLPLNEAMPPSVGEVMPMRASESMPTSAGLLMATHSEPTQTRAGDHPLSVSETTPTRNDAALAQRMVERLSILADGSPPMRRGEVGPPQNHEKGSSASGTAMAAPNEVEPVPRANESLSTFDGGTVLPYSGEALPMRSGEALPTPGDAPLLLRTERRVPIRGDEALPAPAGEFLPTRTGGFLPTRVRERALTHELPMTAAPGARLRRSGAMELVPAARSRGDDTNAPIEHESMPHRIQVSSADDPVSGAAPRWHSELDSESSFGADARPSPHTRVFRRVSVQPQSIQALVHKEVQQALRRAAQQEPSRAIASDSSQIVITALRSPKVMRELMWQLQQAFAERQFRLGRMA